MDQNEILARAFQMFMEGGVSHMWTVSMLQLHEHVVVALDEPATMELQVGTVKYFKEIGEISQFKMPRSFRP